MAKDNPKGAAVQYKVHLKPTEVGSLVIKRMERPHADKSVELRRYIELGYAAEQAGFILDGTILRHAGRVWDTQPNFSALEPSHTTPAVYESATPRTRAAALVKQSVSTGAVQADSSPERDKADNASIVAPSLRANLRGISG